MIHTRVTIKWIFNEQVETLSSVQAVQLYQRPIGQEAEAKAQGYEKLMGTSLQLRADTHFTHVCGWHTRVANTFPRTEL